MLLVDFQHKKRLINQL